MNRRIMLAVTMLAVTVGASGCGSSTTILTVSNVNTAAPLAVAVGVTYGGVPLGFDSAAIAVGSSATGKYHSQLEAGVQLPVTGIVIIRGTTLSLSGRGMIVQTGATNRIDFYVNDGVAYAYNYVNGVQIGTIITLGPVGPA